MADTSQEDAQESTQLFETLRRSGFKASDAHYVIKTIEQMASANLIRSFESEMRATRLTVTIGFTALGVLLTAFALFLSLTGQP